MAGREITRTGLILIISFIVWLAILGPAAASSPPITGLASSTHPDPDVWYANSNPAFNWSALGSATLAGTYDTAGNAFGVAVSGHYAYIADGASGLQIIDVINPASPAPVGTYDTAGNAYDLAISGNYVYVADGADGLVVIDISSPASPSLAGSYNTPDDARGVAISGNYAYVADDGGVGLQIIDISTPANPTFVAGYDTTGTAWGVAVSGNHAYVADGTSGLQIIDVTNPASPALAGTYDTAGYAYDVSVAGNLACVADGTLGLQVIDVSNPASPILKSTYDTPASSLGMDVTGNYAYVADQTSGLQIIDITDPAHPILAAGYNTPGYAEDVVVAGNYVYVADYAAGLQVIKINSIAGYSYVLDQLAATVPDQTVDGTLPSASYAGVTDGEWYFHVRAKDSTGSWSSAAHLRIRIDTTICTVAKPDLHLLCPDYPYHVGFWSYNDYLAKKVSVTWMVENTGTTDAFNVTMTDSYSTLPSISTITMLPAAIGTGTINAGDTGSIVVQYQLPSGFSAPSFHVINTASANDCAGSSYIYP